MYSLVLLAATTTAPNAPEFNGYFRDLFSFRGGCSCNGCSGGARYSCFGGCTGNASYPASCNGCCGGSGFLGLRSGRLFDSGGCCGGGCRGGGCCGGSGFLGLRSGGLFNSGGCCGGGCCGGSGVFARAYGCSGASPYSCFGGPGPSYTPMFNGGLSCAGGPVMGAPPPVFDSAPGVPYAPPEVAPPMYGPDTRAARPVTSPTLVGSNGGTSSTRATVLVRLPVDAQLFADGTALRLTGAMRRFVTPELPLGQEFTYRFRVEYERDGEVVSVTKRVPVRAGGSFTVEFTDLTAVRTPVEGTGATPVSNPSPAVKDVKPATAPAPAPKPANRESPVAPSTADRATITVKLPPGATLYVDNRASPSAEPVRQFTTPPLPRGQEYAYLMKAEVVRDGRPESVMQRVQFRAGERLTVDLTGFSR